MKPFNRAELCWESKKQDTLKILVYSDIFNYPLTKKELYDRGKIELNELEYCLDNLQNEKKIFLIDHFYALRNDSELVASRLKRNKLAEKFMSKAKFMTKVIINFPFIRGVFLSGSISKNCMDEDSDIDFFIVTEPNRLWVAHIFCSILKKTVLLNSRKYFCTNYFVDSEHLFISEQSIYTAIEIKTLIPMYGYEYYENMLNENDWTNKYYPMYPPLTDKNVMTRQTHLQKFLEKLLDNQLGDWIDKWFLAFSIKRRKKNLDPKHFENPNFYTNLQPYVAKSHITDTYPNVMKEYLQKSSAAMG